MVSHDHTEATAKHIAVERLHYGLVTLDRPLLADHVMSTNRNLVLLTQRKHRYSPFNPRRLPADDRKLSIHVECAVGTHGSPKTYAGMRPAKVHRSKSLPLRRDFLPRNDVSGERELVEELAGKRIPVAQNPHVVAFFG